MKNFIKKSLILFFLSILFFCMLIFPKMTVSFASKGLMIWFQTMIPTLLPFMILSSLLIQLGLHRTICRVVSPLLMPLFRLRPDCIYCIFFGFLCGFPMGAKIVSELYINSYISKKEAAYLLSFCNNIGPIYFISVVLLGLSIKNYMPFLFGMYGIPFLYGLVLRYTSYRNLYRESSGEILSKLPATASYPVRTEKKESMFLLLDNSIISSLNAITKLGGYMVIFNLCACIPYLFCNQYPFLFSTFNCLLEISSGIQYTLHISLPATHKLLIIFPTLMFGGISCFAQTSSMIKDTGLSMISYIFHKIIQTFFCIIYYILLILLQQSPVLY